MRGNDRQRLMTVMTDGHKTKKKAAPLTKSRRKPLRSADKTSRPTAAGAKTSDDAHTGHAEANLYRGTEQVSLIDVARVAGVVLAGIDHTMLTVSRLKQAHIPVVEMWDLTANPIDTVIGFSHEAVGVAIARHLFEKGYRRFGIVSVDDPRELRRSRSAMAELQRLNAHSVTMEILTAPAILGLGRDGPSAIGVRQHTSIRPGQRYAWMSAV